MKNRVYIHLVLGIMLFILITTSFSCVPATETVLCQAPESTRSIVQEFSTPIITQSKGELVIRCAETNAWSHVAGEALLPIYQETWEVPFGTKITDVTCTIHSVHTLDLTQELKTVQQPLQPVSTLQTPFYEKDKIQTTDDDWYSVQTTAGLNKQGILKTFITIRLYPLHYLMETSHLQWTDQIHMTLTYREEQLKPSSVSDYEFLILTYDGFSRLLTPLVQHKESHNMTTKVVTLREVYRGEYFPVQGRDKPEQIKYFIKQALEQWGITYVLLVGNFRKMPVRYVHLETDTGGDYEELAFVSDLYYADIYDGEGNFSSWDTDDDGLYGEWPYLDGGTIVDDVDLVPDVHLGRLDCKYRFEVRTVVNKIIDYEEHAADSAWFNRMVVIGGDTFDKEWENGTDYDEGEVAAEKALEFMPGFTATKIYASLGNLDRRTIHRELSKGAGFVYFVGHGNPRDWATHANGDYETWIGNYMNRHILRLRNNGQYPILMVGGCHNSEFDVAPINLLLQGFKTSLYGSTWAPECWSWVFVRTSRGGAIATMGSTGYGGVNIGDYNENEIPDCIEGADGWFETQFFRLYNEENLTVLGETYSQTVTEYVHSFPVLLNRYDAKIVETHVLFGDPTLKIGGYKPTS